MSRHLDTSQRAAVAAEALPMLEAEAAKRMKSGKGAGGSGGRGKKKPSGKKTGGFSDSRDVAAAMFGVSGASVSRAKAIREADPELFVWE